MQGGRAGMVSTVQSMLVVLGRSGFNRCGIPSPSDGEAPELPGGHANPLEAPQFVEDEFAGFWSRECSGEEAWAGLDDPALPGRAGAPQEHTSSTPGVEQCGITQPVLPQRLASRPFLPAIRHVRHPAEHSESPAPSNVSGPKGAPANRTGLSRQRAGGQAARPRGKSVTLKCLARKGGEVMCRANGVKE